MAWRLIKKELILFLYDVHILTWPEISFPFCSWTGIELCLCVVKGVDWNFLIFLAATLDEF